MYEIVIKSARSQHEKTVFCINLFFLVAGVLNSIRPWGTDLVSLTCRVTLAECRQGQEKRHALVRNTITIN